MENLVEVIVGTYEEFVLGFKIKMEENEKHTLIPTFSTRSHIGSVRTIAIGGKFLATGGTDDKIFVYDMKERKEIRILIEHDGTVNTLAFTPDGSHIMSGGADGKIYVYRVSNWEIGAEWKKAHGGSAVDHVACHPSNKLAMSLGSDLTLRTWNLITGHCAFITNLKTRKQLDNTADYLEYSPNGNYFALSGLKIIEIWCIESAKVLKEINFNSKPTSICWLNDEFFVVGCENGKMGLVSVNDDKGNDVKYFEISEKRVKGISYLNKILATASSSGDIALWTVNLDLKTIKKLATTNIGCRPTCIALLNIKQFDENYVLNKIITDSESEIDNKEESIPNLNTKKQKIGKVIEEYDVVDLLSSSSNDENILKLKKSEIKKKEVTRSKKKKLVVESSSDEEPLAKVLTSSKKKIKKSPKKK